MNADDPEFLDIEDVLELHRLSLEQYGGGSGVRDLGLLESALAQPRSAFGEQYAHEGLFAITRRPELAHSGDRQGRRGSRPSPPSRVPARPLALLPDRGPSAQPQ